MTQFPRERVPVDIALEIADHADLPDGSRWAYMEELTGLDAGEICSWLERHSEPAGDGVRRIMVKVRRAL